MNEFISGELGWKGEPGDSAYDIAVKHGYTGTEAEWADSFLNADNFYTKSETYSKSETYNKTEADTNFATQDVATTTTNGLLSAADKVTINTLTAVSAATRQGYMKIGDLGIEWGQLSLTTGSSPSTTSPFDRYSSSGAITFQYTYTEIPLVIASFGGSYYNQISCNSYNTSNTGVTLGMILTSGDSTRTVNYIVIGKVAS